MHLKDKPCLNFDDLCRLCRNTCRHITFAKRLDRFANWKNRLTGSGEEPLIAPESGRGSTRFKGHTQFRIFQFTKTPEGRTRFQVAHNIFREGLHDLTLDPNGSIPLVSRPLTFDVVFGENGEYHDLFDFKCSKVSKEEDIRKMVESVESCKERIHNHLPRVEASRVIHGLYEEVRKQEKDYVLPFNWDVKMYRDGAEEAESRIPDNGEHELRQDMEEMQSNMHTLQTV